MAERPPNAGVEGDPLERRAVPDEADGTLDPSTPADPGGAVDPTAAVEPTGGSLARAVASLGGVNVLAFGAGIIRQKAFAVFLGVGGYGAYALVWALFELLSSVARLGIPTGVLREMSRSFAAGSPGRAAIAFRVASRLAIGVSLALAIATAFVSVVADGVLPATLPRWAVLAVLVAVPLSIFAQLSDAAINALNDLRRLVLGKVLTLVMSLVVSVALIAGLGLRGAVLQIVAGAAIGMVVMRTLLRRRFDVAGHAAKSGVPEQARAVLGAILAVGVAQGAYHIAVTGNLLVFRALVADGLGLDANGIYQGVIGLSRQYTSAVMGGVFVYLFPRLTGLADSPEDFRREVSAGLQFLLATVVPGALMLIGFRDWIVLLIFTEEFLPMVPLLGILAGADVLLMIGTVVHTAVLAAGGVRAYVALGVLGEGLYLVLFLLGLRIFGLPGALWAYVARGILVLPLYSLPPRRTARLRVDRSLWAQGAAGAVLVAGLLALPAGGWTAKAAAVALSAGWLWAFRGQVAAAWRTRR